jgi:lysyl endopeptidase
MEQHQYNIISSHFPAQAIATARLTSVPPQRPKAGAPDDKRERVGFARDVARESESALPRPSWIALPGGGHASRVALVSPHAASLRIALRVRGLPPDAELRFVSPARPDEVLGPVRAAQVDAAMLSNAVYWSPLTEGEEQQVEVWLPPGAAPSAVRIEIAAASHIEVAPSHQLKAASGVGAAQSCEEDVVCVAGSNPALDRAARSVAKLLYTDDGVSYLCTGTLVSDGSAASHVPYLYTAAHCIGSQAAAATLNTFWFFQAASCGAIKSAASYKQLASGATLLYADANTDAALLRLDEPAPQGAWFSGWDPAPLASGASLVALHHPAGDVEKISLGQSLGTLPVGGGAGFDVVAWTSGTTEGGSSGSGLFTFDGREYLLRGGLRGGSASCTSSGRIDDPSNRDYYSRIEQEAPRLAKWLSPAPAPLANYSGLWYDADEPGWGLTIQQNAENRVFATWYGYDTSHRPLWLVMPQATWSSPTALEGTLYRASGSAYDERYDAARFGVTPVGTMRVDFAADGTGRLSAAIDGVSFERPIGRQAF